MQKKRYFGTDGIRGRVGDDKLNPKFIMHLGWAIGQVIAKNNKYPVLIGKDTRISGYMFESALEAGLSAAGVNIRLLGPMPTPSIAYLTKNTHAQAGIVISASHNPFQDNGIKIFMSDGSKASDEIELMIEQQLKQSMHSVSPHQLGKARRINDAPRRYIEFCKSKFNNELQLDGLRVVLDCAHGATYHVAPKIFEELGVTVLAHGVEPNGLNINKNCGAVVPEHLQSLVRKHNADLGIAFDGDGDRLIISDNQGAILDGDEILYILAKQQIDQLNGAVVGTVMSNLGLEQAIKALNLDFLRANVGDRNITQLLRQKMLALGGETSGHIVNLKLSTTGDGIIAALQVLESIVTTGKSLNELMTGMSKLCQTMCNIPLEKQVSKRELSQINRVVKKAQKSLQKNERILLRPSGTEKLLRLMVEGEDKQKISDFVVDIETEIKKIINAQ